jgi:hypothetical protein
VLPAERQKDKAQVGTHLSQFQAGAPMPRGVHHFQ